MLCKVGGLVLLRRNDMAGEWHRLCAQALTPVAVSDEPLIHSGRNLQVRANSESTEVSPENQGDMAAQKIFDVRVTDTDAPTNHNRDPVKVLAAHEEENKDKYLETVWRAGVTSPH